MTETTLANVPLEKIETRSDFNPRTEFDQDALEQLSASIAQVGVTTPITLRQNGGDAYYLVAGERRFIAAKMAGLKEIPAQIRPDETDELLVAITENIHRVDLSPVMEARAIKRLRAEGYTNRKQLAKKLALSERTIKAREQLMDFPEDVLDMLEAGDFPTSWVEPLLPTTISPRLCKAAILTLIEDQNDEFYDGGTYSAHDVEENLPHVIRRLGPDDGVFVQGQTYEVATLGEIPEAAQVEISKARELLAQQGEAEWTPAIRITAEDVEAARTVKAAPAELPCIIDPAFLVEGLADRFKRFNKEQRRAIREAKANEEGDKQLADAEGHGEDQTSAQTTSDGDADQGPSAYQIREEEREAAEPYNEELGQQLVTRLQKIQLNPTIARMVVKMALHDCEDLVMRGLIYVFPGWVQTKETSRGTKNEYLGRQDAIKKTSEWIDSARTADEIFGRFAIIVLAAELADERAVARSNRFGQRPTATSDSPHLTSKAISEGLDALAKKLTPAMREKAEAVTTSLHASGSATNVGADNGYHDLVDDFDE